MKILNGVCLRDNGSILLGGREIHELYPLPEKPRRETVLEVRNLGDGKQYRNISFDLHGGEILGVAGLPPWSLAGAASTEVKALFLARSWVPSPWVC